MLGINNNSQKVKQDFNKMVQYCFQGFELTLPQITAVFNFRKIMSTTLKKWKRNKKY